MFQGSSGWEEDFGIVVVVFVVVAVLFQGPVLNFRGLLLLLLFYVAKLCLTAFCDI